MATANYSHSWIRTPSSNIFGPEVPPILGDIDEPFAAYIADAGYGVYFRIISFPLEEDVDHVWRHKVVSKTGVFIFAFDIRFRRETDGTRRLFGNYVLADGTALPEVDVSYQISGAFAIAFELTGHLQAPNYALYLSSLDTANAYYEYRIGGVLESGGLDTPAGKLGDGFDLRDLVIQDFEVVEPVTNWGDPDNHTMNLSGEVWTLPVSTSLYPDGWVPVGDVTFYAHVEGASIASGDLLPVATTIGGHIASFSKDWDGRDDQGNLVEGYNTATVTATAQNPDTPDYYQISQDSDNAFVYTYFCQKDGNGQCMGGLSYSSHNSARSPQSMGYGWSSEASIRIMTSGDDVFLQMASGMSIRWKVNGLSYEPFTPGNYAKLENDGQYWRVTFKDRTGYRFSVTTGRLVYRFDHNDNYTFYTYNGSGHLTSIYDDNGNSVSFNNRSDGQPNFMVANGRLTNYHYYPSDGSPSANRLMQRG